MSFISNLPEALKIDNFVEIDQTTQGASESVQIFRKYVTVKADYNNTSKIYIAVSPLEKRPDPQEFIEMTRGEKKFFGLRQRIKRLWFYCAWGVQHLSYRASNYAINEYPSEIVRIRENVEPRPITSRHRTGRAIFIDTFENYFAVLTEKWALSGDAGYVTALNTDYPKQGKYAVKMTTNNVDTESCSIDLYLGAFPKGRFGFECDWMSFAQVANIEEIKFDLQYFDGTNDIRSQVKWLGEANKKWQYLNSAGTYTDITGGAQDLEVEATLYPLWHHLKLIADLQNEEYVKLLSDWVEYDLSNIAVHSSANALSPLLNIDLTVKTGANNATTIYVDNIIITDEE